MYQFSHRGPSYHYSLHPHGSVRSVVMQACRSAQITRAKYREGVSARQSSQRCIDHSTVVLSNEQLSGIIKRTR